MRAPRMLTVITAAALFAGGCYEYVPVAPTTPAPGETVRVDITDQGASALTGVLGPGVLQVQGMVLRQDPAALSLVVNTWATARNGELAGNGEAVLLPFQDIRALFTKRLSKKRSLLFGAAFAGGAVLAATVFTDLGRQLTTEDPNPDPTPEMRSGSRFRPTGLRIWIPIR